MEIICTIKNKHLKEILWFLHHFYCYNLLAHSSDSALLFYLGMGGMALFMVTFVICVEYVGARYTMFTGIIIEVPFALGELILGLEAYFIRDWYTLQIVAHLPLIVLLGLYFLVPESPRWLLAMGRTEEAKKIIQKGAEINKKNLPDSLFEVRN